MHKRINFWGIALLALLVIAGGFVSRTVNISTQAQEPEPTAVLELDQTAEQQIRSYAEALASQDISAYNIVYLIAENANSSALISGDQMNSSLGMQVVNSWDEFLSLNTEQGTDALVVHVSAFDLVDRTWTRNAYRNQRVPIIGINLYFDEMADLTGNQCLSRGIESPFVGDYFVGQFYAVWAENAEDVPILNASYLDTCIAESDGGEIAGISTGSIRVSKSGSQLPLASADDVTSLRNILIDYLFNATLPRLSFE